MQSLLPFFASIKDPQWDAVFAFFLVAAGFFWGISGGKKKMAMSVLALYALISFFPYLYIEKFTAGQSPINIFWIKVGFFLALLVLLVLFLLRAFKGIPKDNSAWWEIFLLSILAVGLLLTALVSLAPPLVIKNNLLHLSQFTLKLFADPVISGWWIILAIFGVIFF